MKARVFSMIPLSLSLLGALVIQTERPLATEHALPATLIIKSSAENAEVAKQRVVARYGKLPLSFEANPRSDRWAGQVPVARQRVHAVFDLYRGRFILAPRQPQGQG